MRACSRATSLNDFQTLQDLVFSDDSRARALAFTPRPDDVLICPYAKSGTTWLQHITHGLRSQGDLSFDEISLETPWIEVAHDVGIDLDAPQPFHPRIFKSHFNWYDIPKGGRYICSIRDPLDVAISYYRYMEGWFIEPGTIDLDSFANAFCPHEDQLNGYWLHLVSWWKQRHDERVLLLSYENMIDNLPDTVIRIATFLQLDVGQEIIDRVITQSTREFMLRHKAKFDERGVRALAQRRAGLPFDSDACKVTQGYDKTVSRYTLSPVTVSKFNDLWKKLVRPHCNLANYDELRIALA